MTNFISPYLEPQSPPAVPPSSPAPAPIIPESLPKKSYKVITLILVPFLAILAMIVFYVMTQARTMYKEVSATPTPSATPVASADPTEGWQVYTNSNPEYSFKYPSNWIKDDSDSSIKGECVGPTFYTSSAKSSWLSICRVSSADELEAIEATHKQQKQYTNVITTTVNTLPAISFELQQFDSQYEYSVELKSRNKDEILWFHLISDIQNKEENKMIFDKILSTFKFTQPKTVQFSIKEIGDACIALRSSSKYWSEKYHECNGADNKEELQKYCAKYGGTFVPEGNSCRHAQEEGIPCGPDIAYYCAF